MFDTNLLRIGDVITFKAQDDEVFAYEWIAENFEWLDSFLDRGDEIIEVKRYIPQIVYKKDLENAR